MYFMNFKSAIDKTEKMVADFKPFTYKEIKPWSMSFLYV